MAGFYYSRGNQRFGPVSAARLKELAANSRHGPDDLVAQEGSVNWHPAKAVKGLFSTPLPSAR